MAAMSGESSPGLARVAPAIFPLAACLGLAASATAAERAANTPSFEKEVMAVLSKAGCNAGTCHGNRNGKGGFKLSLRGEDPERDFLALSRESFARRADRIVPERSLILRKPTLQVPHEGGRRFATGSLEYDIFHRWIAAGLPPDPPAAPGLDRLEAEPREEVLFDPADRVQLRVRAHFTDGSERDVTTLACYELSQPIAHVSPGGAVLRQSMGETTVLVRYLDRQVPVRLAFLPARPGFTWPAPPAANYIDEHVLAKLRALRIAPSDLASDAVFLRRAYLDALGVLPSAAEARAFSADPRPDKRARLVDGLLERPEFAESWALKWSDLLRNEERGLDRKGMRSFHDWIRLAIASGKPLDQFARELVAATGSTYQNPAANFYRANRDPITRAEAVAQVFLGTRLQCARCHNHPFERWTQDDYHDWAAVFGGVKYKVLQNLRGDPNDGHEFKGEQVVWVAPGGEVVNPRTARPAQPRFLGEGKPVAAGPEVLEALAAWLVRPENSLFARVMANRIWYHLLGRGIVDPIDDFRATNPPSNPALLEALAGRLIASGFDLRALVRDIMNSRTYQLASEPSETNREDAANFSRALVRRLAAEQILDCQSQAIGVPPRFNGYPDGLRAGQLPGLLVRARRTEPTAAERFLKLFGKPPRLLTCECERSNETTLAQAFQLVSGGALQEALKQPENALSRLLAAGKPPAGVVEDLYWTALSRSPSAEEARAAAEHLAGAGTPREGIEDLAWALLNAKEFLLRP
jgi:hypothetical protein